ncbi:MAG: anthranilate synthase component I family protein [Ginsengibacter sp.]
MENNEYDFDKSYECIAGMGGLQFYPHQGDSPITGLSDFHERNRDWIFGHLSYDYKNHIDELHSDNYDRINFPDAFFFIPELVFIISEHEVRIGAEEGYDTARLMKEIYAVVLSSEENEAPELSSRFSRVEYIDSVTQLQQQIARGDCYEICFCQEFFSENAEINPIDVYLKLNTISPNPFSAFYKYQDKFLMCASPERFLKNVENNIISQPIKGTARRALNDLIEDEQQRNSLSLNPKERAENTMIVDLVRNDLSKVCAKGSVEVKEFLEIYSFPQVHQMISTIGGKLKDGVKIEEIFHATFPMGSMTGAPKKRAMELIEKYERTRRGLYSGTVGYIAPNGDFDFNVVIRSILYNEKRKYLSVNAGSAITNKSNSEKEFEECMIKLEAMKKALL